MAGTVDGAGADPAARKSTPADDAKKAEEAKAKKKAANDKLQEYLKKKGANLVSIAKGS